MTRDHLTIGDGFRVGFGIAFWLVICNAALLAFAMVLGILISV